MPVRWRLAYRITLANYIDIFDIYIPTKEMEICSNRVSTSAVNVASPSIASRVVYEQIPDAGWSFSVMSTRSEERLVHGSKGAARDAKDAAIVTLLSL